MKVYESKKIRNIAVLGHSGCGKTNLIEMLAHTANINRIPKLTDKVNMTHNLRLIPLEYKDNKINLIDTPGYFDFCGDVMSAIQAADAAIIVIDATDPLQVGTEKALEFAEGIPKIMFVNKIDNENARYKDVIEMLNYRFENKIVPMISPYYKDKKFIKLHNVFENIDDLEGEFKDQAIAVKEALMEHIAEADDEMLEKYFSGEQLSADDIRKGVTYGVKTGDIIPVISGSAINNVGVVELLDNILNYVENQCTDEEGEFEGQVFKTFIDPFVGKISYIKVLKGVAKKDMEVYDFRTKNKIKFSNLYTLNYKELEDAKQFKAGDIFIATKITGIKTGDIISGSSEPEYQQMMEFPKPQIYYALSAKTKNDEDKIATVISKLVIEDPTLDYYRNSDTKQALLGGQGEMHIKAIQSKMKNKFGVEVGLEDLKVPYKETIKGIADVQGKHKKQSGGHGQYGDVKIRFERSDEHLEFTEELFGGSVPKSYIPAVEKGIIDSMKKGILAGFPVTNIKACLYDGSYHDVDSSEMAFKMAAAVAFKKGMQEATPILLEPIMNLKITIPDEYMGDVMGDINKRRGKILGMEQGKKGKQVIKAIAPQAETFKYAIDLKSMTQGRGFFEMEFEKYGEVPAEIAKKVIENYEK